MIFISHSRDDKEQVQSIIELLKKNEIIVWHDKNIKSGTSWKKSIFNAIIESEVVITFLSKSYIDSPMCRMEAYLAQCYNKKVIPVMIKENCWKQLHSFRELSNMRDLSVLNLVENTIFGLKLSEQEQREKLVLTLKGINARNDKNHELFISYRKNDAIYATKLAKDLRNLKNINCWVATINYNLGENWQKNQWEALMNVKGLIVILSKEISESEYIRKEILIAITRGIPIYPVLTETSNLESNEYLRELNRTLDETNSFEMRELNNIQWFYPNNPNYNTMLEEISSIFHENNK